MKPKPEIAERVTKLLNELSLDEKLSMLDGDWPFFAGARNLGRDDGYHEHPWNAGVVERLGIHGVRFVDGPRGVVLKGGATTFPVPMARGASWDVELEEKIGDAIGRELQALGGNLFGGVCINLLRHPAWGRAQETYGEDPVALGAFGAALARGVQRHAMACVKHFALNSIENARFQVDVSASPRALHEVYLPHFKEVVDAGVAAVMSAYNSVNGEWCGQNRDLLTGILKERWGFEGFVLTDFVMGIRDAERAILAGQDLEMPFQMHFHQSLKRLVEAGRVPLARIDDAVGRILGQQLELGQPREVSRECLGSPEHRALARESARKAIVLLKNEDGLLPLQGNERVALIGKLAARPNLGDHGSSDGRPEHVVTPKEGLEAALAEAGGTLHYEPGESLAAARRAAREADVAVVVVGYTARNEGEYLTPPDFGPFADGIPRPGPLRWLFAPAFMRPAWRNLVGLLSRLGRRTVAPGAVAGSFDLRAGGDRASLTLAARDEALIRAVAEANERTVVILMSGSAVLVENWIDTVPGLLMLWYPGMEGGHALADVLLGKFSPSGRMPFVTPRSETHLPRFDRRATKIGYDLWHGYRKLDRDNIEPRFPFGYGLSYTRFAYGPLIPDRAEVGPEDELELRLEITNLGERDADEVVQLYAATPLGSQVDRPSQELKAFARVEVPAGATRGVRLTLPVRKLAYFDEARDAFVVEPIEYELRAARYAGDPESTRVRICVR